MNLLKALRWLLQQNPSHRVQALAGAALRWQMLPSIRLDFAIASCTIASRSFGGLTGSRVAGALGRIPVRAAFDTVRPDIVRWGFHCDVPAPLMMCSFVDMLYWTSHSAGGALSMAAAVQRELLQTWGLRYKDKSCLCMPVAGSPELLCVPELRLRWPGWKFVDDFPVLGMRVSSSGSCSRDVHECLTADWSAFVQNVSGHASANLRARQKMAVLTRVGRAALDYRMTRWPQTPSLHRDLDSLQRRCGVLIENLPRRRDEPMESWARRRSRSAGALARAEGLWSARHRQRTQDWLQHLRRPQNSDSPAAVLLAYRGSSWRASRRIAMGSNASTAGRLASRVLTHVHPRWEDSVAESPPTSS